MLRNGLLFLVFALCIGTFGCNSSGGPVAENCGQSQHEVRNDLEPAVQIPGAPLPVDILDDAPKHHGERGLVTIFLAGDDPIHLEPVLKKHFVKTENNKDSVQLIFHPENRDQFNVDKLRDISNISEASDFAEIGDQIVSLLRVQAPKRILLYLEGHGAPSGSFCYHKRYHCTGSTQELMMILNKIDQFNRTQKAGAKLEHLLIVPFSCYNKMLIAPLVSQLEAASTLGFKVSAIHMQNVEPDYSNSAAKQLGIGVIPVGPVPISRFNFRPWAKQYLSAQGFKIRTLEDYLSIRNNLEKWLKAEKRERHYEAKYYAPGCQPFDTFLGDFDLSVLLEVSLIRGARGVRYAPRPFPAGLNHQGLLKDSIPKKLWPLVRVFQVGGQKIDLSQPQTFTPYDPVGTVEFTLDLTN